VYDLPIHRLGDKKGPIFAYSDELDDWMKYRYRPVLTNPTELPRSILLHVPLNSEEPNYHNTSSVSMIHDLRKDRSSRLVTHAYKMWESLSQNNLHLIAQYFREAIELDPNNASAFAGLSLAFISDGLWGLICIPAAYASARTALQRALEIDSKLPDALYAEAWLKMVFMRDWQGARRGFIEASKQSPSTHGEAISWALLKIAEGFPREASALLKKNEQHFMLRSDAIVLYCWSEYLAGEYSDVLLEIEQYRAGGRYGPLMDVLEALTYIQFSDELDPYIQYMETQTASFPNSDIMRGALGYVYGVTGQSRRAHELLDTMTNQRMRNKCREPYAVALVLIGLNQIQAAVKQLEQSYHNGSLWSLGFLSDPILASLRKEPLFQQFLSKVSYPVPDNSDPLCMRAAV
jgi:tetratricopeptide (TPR) repeat protein